MTARSLHLARLLPALAFLGLADVASAAGPKAFHESNVLGTSFDLLVNTPHQADAEKVRDATLAEVRRLETILSAYEPSAELAKLNATLDTVKLSPELADVLAAYDAWHARSNGAFSAQVGALKALWENGTPSDADVERATSAIRGPLWQLDRAGGTVKRLADRPINVDSLGKGYIVSAALAAAKKNGPAVEGILLNIGGDLAATGFGVPGRKIKWTLNVADPANPAENARSVVELRLTDLTVATSGSYARGNHLIDPRTGRPTPGDRGGIASATVIAPDNATANALATSVCVLGVDAGLKLVKETPGAECLIVLNGGGRIRSENFKRFEIPRGDGTPASAIADESGERIPTDFVVDVALPVKPSAERPGERPYVAVWIEDDQQQHVKTLAVWGNDEKWLRQMDHWSKIAKGEPSLIAKVTRATREAGKYQLDWDGTDTQGRKVPQGRYDVWVEVSYEHGARVGKNARIECGAGPQRVALDATDGFDVTPIEFKAK